MSDIIARNAGQLGAILRRVRKNRGLTQGRLGALMGARQATVSRMEDGPTMIRLGTLMDALSALDLELVVRPRSKANMRELEGLF